MSHTPFPPRTERAVQGRAPLRELTDELGVLYGGDWNPEQWEPSVWREDVRLMREAGVNLVTVGVFSWARYEPEPGARDFAWMDEVLDLLHEHGIAADLATPVASPPPWLGVEHPDTLPVDADGVRLVPGSRNQFSPSSATYRAHALAITRDLAARYARHPAVRLWHVGNEYGQIDFGDEAAHAFRGWLRERYGTVDALNEAWGTAFWSQRYRTFDDVLPPRRMPYLVNPTQSLDFRRFTSDQLLACYREQHAAIRAAGATQPVTTNFMGFFPHVDSWSWADDVDVVADDQYPDQADPRSPADAALVQDLMRGLGGGAPWLLLEQAVGATSWREHNLPKSPERMRLDSLQAVARGADGICFFQWRASTAGAERFHSAMLPHAGPDTAVHRGVRRLGQDLAKLRPVTGTRVPARTALLFDWESWWAAEEPGRITERLRTLDQVRAFYRPLWDRGIVVDVVRPGAPLDGYDLVVVPQTYLLDDDAAKSLRAAVEGGAGVVVGPMTGVADRNAHVLPGRFPVPVTDLLGASGEEWVALPDGGVEVVGTQPWAPALAGRAEVHAELLRADDDTDVLLRFAEGHLAGEPAVTRRRTGPRGGTWYVGAVLDEGLLGAVLDDAIVRAGVGPAVPGAVPAVHPGSHVFAVTEADGATGVEAVRRGDAVFLLNRSGEHRDVVVPGRWTDLLTGADVVDVVPLPVHDVAVLIPVDPTMTNSPDEPRNW
ncbi:beta-galactosidase [Xylanimonas sp. McL0601]|uniref:beta-galactosidase n=1 Tax=Xylanimonas sp. McL0601 TaxID=3414739 RepID=UPI003CE8C914